MGGGTSNRTTVISPGNQDHAAECGSGPESSPMVRGQGGQIREHADGCGTGEGRSAPPGAAGWLRSDRVRDVLTGAGQEETLVRGGLPENHPRCRARVSGERVDSRPQGVEFAQADEATWGLVPFSGCHGAQNRRGALCKTRHAGSDESPSVKRTCSGGISTCCRCPRRRRARQCK